MKRPDQNTLMLLALAALAVLLLGQCFSLAETWEPSTVTATLYTGGPPVYVSGVVIRQERRILADGTEDWTLQVSGGERVAAGQTILRRETAAYRTAARTASLLREGREAASEPLVSRREQLRAAIRDLGASEGTARIQWSRQVSGLLLGEKGGLTNRLEEAEAALRQLAPEPAGTVSAPEAGVFFPVADGLEEILTPEDPWSGWPLPPAPVPERAVGRLITSDTWYFRTEYALLPDRPETGDTLDGLLLGGIGLPVTMTLEEIRGGLALLSCETALSEVAGVRELEIRVFPRRESGVAFPAEALCTVGGEDGVWCMVGEAAVFKPVVLRCDLGDTLVAELDYSTTASLWPGDRVYRKAP